MAGIWPKYFMYRTRCAVLSTNLWVPPLRGSILSAHLFISLPLFWVSTTDLIVDFVSLSILWSPRALYLSTSPAPHCPFSKGHGSLPFDVLSWHACVVACSCVVLVSIVLSTSPSRFGDFNVWLRSPRHRKVEGTKEDAREERIPKSLVHQPDSITPSYLNVSLRLFFQLFFLPLCFFCFDLISLEVFSLGVSLFQINRFFVPSAHHSIVWFTSQPATTTHHHQHKGQFLAPERPRPCRS